jgi:hypothetical protein
MRLFTKVRKYNLRIVLILEYLTYSIRLVPNAIVRGKADRRHYIGDQLDQCTDFSSLYYRLPFEKVYKKLSFGQLFEIKL